MDKKFLMFALVVGACSTTPPPPPSQDAIKGAAAITYVAGVCAQRGWLTNQQAAASYVNFQRSIAAQAPNQVAVLQAELARSGPVQLHHCRQLEFMAAQYSQQETSAAQQRAEEAQRDAIAALSRAATNQQTQQMGTNFQYPVMNLPAPQITMPGSNRVTCTHIGINTICR